TGRAGPWAAFGGNAETVSDFRVAVTVTQLAFTVPPSTTAAGAAITPAVQVTAQDALGATVVSFTGDVTVALATNPAGGTLGGTTTLPAVNGVATFANLTIERVGQGYTLRASTGALSQTSAPFEITTAAAGKLAMVTQPSAAAQSGVAFARVVVGRGVAARNAGPPLAIAGVTGPPLRCTPLPAAACTRRPRRQRDAVRADRGQPRGDEAQRVAPRRPADGEPAERGAAARARRRAGRGQRRAARPRRDDRGDDHVRIGDRVAARVLHL